MCQENTNAFSAPTFLRDLVTEAQVRRTMRAWAAAVLKVRKKKVFVFNPKSGPTANKNYKQWCTVAARLDLRGFELRHYFEWRLTVDRKEQLPFLTQIATAYWLDRFSVVRPKWRPGADKYLAEIQDGAAVLEFLVGHAEGCRVDAASNVVLQLWSALPPTWLAVSRAFWEHVAARRIVTEIASEHFRRASELHVLFKKDPALAGELSAAFQKETGAVVYR